MGDEFLVLLKAMLDSSNIKSEMKDIQTLVDKIGLDISPDINTGELSKKMKSLLKNLTSEINIKFNTDFKTNDIESAYKTAFDNMTGKQMQDALKQTHVSTDSSNENYLKRLIPQYDELIAKVQEYIEAQNKVKAFTGEHWNENGRTPEWANIQDNMLNLEKEVSNFGKNSTAQFSSFNGSLISTSELLSAMLIDLKDVDDFVGRMNRAIIKDNIFDTQSSINKGKQTQEVERNTEAVRDNTEAKIENAKANKTPVSLSTEIVPAETAENIRHLKDEEVEVLGVTEQLGNEAKNTSQFVEQEGKSGESTAKQMTDLYKAKAKAAEANAKLRQSADDSVLALDGESQAAEKVKQSVAEFDKLGQRIVNLENAGQDVSDLKAKFESLKSSMNEGGKSKQTAQWQIDFKNLNSDVTDCEKSIKEITQIQRTNLKNSIGSLLGKTLSKDAKNELTEYFNLLKSDTPIINKKLEQIIIRVKEIDAEEKSAGRGGATLFDQWKKKLGSLVTYLTSFASFYKIVGYGKQAIDVVKDYNSALTTISYTMDVSKNKLDNLGDSVVALAKNMRTSINDAMAVAQIYANMETTPEKIVQLAQPTIVLSNLTGANTSTASDQIQAVVQQFNMLEEESMHIADVYDYISSRIAVDYSKGVESISEAVQVAGQSAEAAGLSFEQLSAIVATTIEKTRQEGSQIGNALKTIMVRLSKASNLDETIDNETLSQASAALHNVGVEVYNLDGSFRQFDVIMSELANKWDSLSDAEQANISYAVAATRQTNTLKVILQQFSRSMDLAAEASETEGNALANQEKYLDSLDGRAQGLKTSLQSLALDAIDDDTLKNLIFFLQKSVDLLDIVIDKLGVLGTLSIGGGIFAAFKKKDRGETHPFNLISFKCVLTTYSTAM